MKSLLTDSAIPISVYRVIVQEVSILRPAHQPTKQAVLEKLIRLHLCKPILWRYAPIGSIQLAGHNFNNIKPTSLCAAQSAGLLLTYMPVH